MKPSNHYVVLVFHLNALLCLKTWTKDFKRKFMKIPNTRKRLCSTVSKVQRPFSSYLAIWPPELRGSRCAPVRTLQNQWYCLQAFDDIPATDTGMQKVTCRNMFDKPRNCLLWIHSINLAIKKRRLQESEQTLWERNRRFEYALFNVYTFTVCVVFNASIRLNLGPILTQNVLHQGLHLVNQRLWFSNLASSDTVQISFQNISNVCSLPGVWVPNNMAYQHEQGAPNLAWGTWTAERRHLEARWGRKP